MKIQARALLQIGDAVTPLAEDERKLILSQALKFGVNALNRQTRDAKPLKERSDHRVEMFRQFRVDLVDRNEGFEHGLVASRRATLDHEIRHWISPRT
jgi:hypothetical protein